MITLADKVLGETNAVDNLRDRGVAWHERATDETQLDACWAQRCAKPPFLDPN